MTRIDKNELQNLDKQTLIEMLEASADSMKAMQQSIDQLNKMVDALLVEVRGLRAARFGRKTEKVMDETPGQLHFIFNEAEGTIDIVKSPEDIEEPDVEEVIQPKAYKRRKRKGKREEDLADITTTVIEHTLSDEDLLAAFPDGKWKRLPDEVYKRLEFHPATFEVIEHHIAVYAGNGEKAVIKADRPVDLMRNSIATPSLVAGILNYKYVNAMPIARLATEFDRQDVHIPSQNMCHWVIKCSDQYLSRLYRRMRSDLNSCQVIQADETPTIVNRDGRPAGSKSFMWVYRSGEFEDRPIILYDYQKTRSSEHPREFLKDYSGYIISDGYQAYHTLDNERDDLKVSGCWTHARRGFAEVEKTLGKGKAKGTVAHTVLNIIGKIYHEEGKLKTLSPEDRLKQRSEKIAPLVDVLFAYLEKQVQFVAPKSATGKAISYCLNQKKYLKVFLEDGHVPIDNNAAERAIRPFCLGKKNWYVIDTISGAKASAVLYSIAETAKANNLKPYEYFKYLLEEIPKHGEFEDESYMDDLLPWSDSLPDFCRKKTQAETQNKDQ